MAWRTAGVGQCLPVKTIMTIIGSMADTHAADAAALTIHDCTYRGQRPCLHSMRLMTLCTCRTISFHVGETALRLQDMMTHDIGY